MTKIIDKIMNMGNEYFVPSGQGSSGAIVSITEPTNPVRGQLWYDMDNNKMYIYNGENWLDFATPVAPSTYKYMQLTIDESVSNPANMITYTSEDALAMSQSDWDDFFGIYPVLLNTDGSEYKKLNPNNFQQFEDGTSASSYTANANYDVMIAFPRMGFKASKSGNIITIDITDDPDASAQGYKYYAHSYGMSDSDQTLSSANARQTFYLGAYKGYVDSNKLRSWYGKSPSVSATIGTFRTYAQTNRSAGWHQSGYFQLMLRQIYFLFKYKTTNGQTAVGRGYVDASGSTYGGPAAGVNTYNKGMDYGTTSGTEPMKLFGLEHFWGGVWEWIDGLASNSNGDWAVNNNNFQDDGHGSGYKSIGSFSLANGAYITKMKGDTEGLFYPTSNSGGSDSTYYTDCAWRDSGARVAMFGGKWDNASVCGAFCWALSYAASNSYASVGARLMFL